MTINPNAVNDYIFNKVDLLKANVYPRFIHQLKFKNFRHITDLEVNFLHPVTVISGTNKSGKTTILLTIACSHFDFKKRNYSNGKLERNTWSNVLKVTNHDSQTFDWTYFLRIKTGDKIENKRGQRKVFTKKWNGLGKKETQIKGVNVVYLDLERILPARYFSSVIHKRALKAAGTAVSTQNQIYIEECLSYIFEQSYKIKQLASHQGRELLAYSETTTYSSYNSASGEDVVSRILIDCIEAPQNSLILIDEIELGIHPKVQRRLMDVIFDISKKGQKQFIITTHSGTIISCVPDKARVFIDTHSATNSATNPIGINAVLSKMDSQAHPLIDIFCEDELAKKLIQKALQEIDRQQSSSLYSRLFNIIVSGSANDTYTNFIVRERIYSKVNIKSGHSCILDGDMRNNSQYQAQNGLYFLPSNMPPEKMLCDIYEKSNPNSTLRYHIDNSDPHCLFKKMQEIVPFASEDEAFNACFNLFQANVQLRSQFDLLIEFLKNECARYSKQL